MGAYIYENHRGGFYPSDYSLDFNDLYCEQCGDSDWEMGWYDSTADFLKENGNNFWCSLNPEDGGYHLEEWINELNTWIGDNLNIKEARKIVIKAVKDERGKYGS